MIKAVLTLGLALISAMGVASAKVLHSGPNGFAVSHEATVTMPPQAAYDRFLQIGEWWSKAHTFSGDPKNISIDQKPGGCWCEALPKGGFVKHMEVASAAPGERLVFHGGLGPLHFMGATGAMTVKFAAADGGTKVTLLYQVTGYDPDGFAKLGPAVDGVLGEQLANYATSAGR
jgi:uncharacterized protein YndB with AHSA1/START domain